MINMADEWRKEIQQGRDRTENSLYYAKKVVNTCLMSDLSKNKEEFKDCLDKELERFQLEPNQENEVIKLIRSMLETDGV